MNRYWTKAPGNHLFLLGRTGAQLGGSHFLLVEGLDSGNDVPPVDLETNLRVMQACADPDSGFSGVDLRRVLGGALVQDWDRGAVDLDKARVATHRAATPEEMGALEFAWRVAKHVKSNAIVFANGVQTVAVGAGQMSRVDAARFAVQKAQLPLAGTCAASDGFFPFRDGLDEIANAGATAVIQPGGSVRDPEVVKAADEHDLAMVFTGVRHFRH